MTMFGTETTPEKIKFQNPKGGVGISTFLWLFFFPNIQ